MYTYTYVYICVNNQLNTCITSYAYWCVCACVCMRTHVCMSENVLRTLDPCYDCFQIQCVDIVYYGGHDALSMFPEL